MKYKEIAALSGLGILTYLVMGLRLQTFGEILRFTLTSFFLFFFPVMLYVINIETDLFKKYVLTAILGLSVVPTLYNLLGYLFVLSRAFYITVPIIFSIPGIIIIAKKERKPIGK